MPTRDAALHNRFGQLSDQALLTLLASEESEGLTRVEFRALTEELVRRGLRKSTAPSAPIERESTGGRTYSKAPLVPRLIAAMIDGAIVVASFITMWWGFIVVAMAGQEDAAAILLAPLFLALLLYIFLRDARRGQSIGKRAARLMVVSVTSGRPCTARDSAFRSLVLILSGVLIPGVGWLIEPIAAIFDKDGRRLGDRAADTQVIEVSSYNAA